MHFGQLFRGDADESRKQLKKLVVKTVPVTQTFVNNPLCRPSRLNLVAMKAHGTRTYALLDKGVVANLISWDFFCLKSTKTPTATNRQVK